MTPDIAVLMESQSNQVFQEMVNLYPGALRMQEVVNQYRCGCPDPETCSRQSFQLVLGQASQGSSELAAKFIEEASRTCETHEQIRDLMVRYYDEIPRGQITLADIPGGYESFSSLQDAADFLSSIGSGPEQD